MHALGLALLFFVCLLALLSLVFGAPGTLLIVAAALIYAWATDFSALRWSTIGWLALLAVVGEAVEFLSAARGAPGSRPSRRVSLASLVGAFAGGIVGLPFLFGVGSLLGALAGAFLGAAIASSLESGDVATALSSGWAALRGRFLGFVLKSAIAVVMITVVALATLR